MSLSSEPVIQRLSQQFVCGYGDITAARYAGASDRHQPRSLAVNTTNGAGPRNVQIFFLAADRTVLHCLLGYWNPEDLLCEADLAAKLNAVWNNPGLNRAAKDRLFKQMHISHIRQHSKEMVARSELQPFDKHFELYRCHSDCLVKETSATRANRTRTNGSEKRFKTTDVIVHERMSSRPFVAFGQFDIERYIDYGAQRYDREENLNDPERFFRVAGKYQTQPDSLAEDSPDVDKSEHYNEAVEKLSGHLDQLYAQAAGQGMRQCGTTNRSAKPLLQNIASGNTQLVVHRTINVNDKQPEKNAISAALRSKRSLAKLQPGYRRLDAQKQASHLIQDCFTNPMNVSGAI